jgi:S1-C subfamily serine protease
LIFGERQDARKAFERALSSGGYDQMNADAIKFARRLLERIPLAEEPRQPETPRANELPPSTEGKKFGSGFVVSNQGHILTNNHVVAGCKTLATRDGKPLQVLMRNFMAKSSHRQTRRSNPSLYYKGNHLPNSPD